MSETNDETGGGAPRTGKSKLLLVAVIIALVAGGGGFYAVYSGLLTLPFPGGSEAGQHAGAAGHGGEGEEHAGGSEALEPGAFVTLDPLVISLGPQSQSKHLKISLVVEAAPGREGDINAVEPRVIDILNGFLRAVDEREFELPRSMERLRAQMLRRVRLVTPVGAVRDLLIQEFVLN